MASASSTAVNHQTVGDSSAWWFMVAVHAVTAITLVTLPICYPHYLASFFLPGPVLALGCLLFLLVAAAALRLLEVCGHAHCKEMCDPSTKRDIGGRMRRAVRRSASEQQPPNSPTLGAAQHIVRASEMARELKLVRVSTLEAALVASSEEAVMADLTDSCSEKLLERVAVGARAGDAEAAGAEAPCRFAIVSYRQALDPADSFTLSPALLRSICKQAHHAGATHLWLDAWCHR